MTRARIAAVVLGLLVAARAARAKDAPATVDAERTADVAAYERERAALDREHAGEWAVIAGGKVVATAKALEDVEAKAPEAKHRFVFRVGEDGDAKEEITEW